MATYSRRSEPPGSPEPSEPAEPAALDATLAPHGGSAARAQRLRGVLDLCVLAALEQHPTHGYEVARTLEVSGVGEVKGGTLYPLLSRLEQQGLLVATWEKGSGGPRRKSYAVTGAGRGYLHEHGGAWLGLAESAGALLASAGCTAEGRQPAVPLQADEIEGAKR